ncbi:hypothetical protein ACKWTF_013778 [Chironomus riparius]
MKKNSLDNPACSGYSKVLDCVCGEENDKGLIILHTSGKKIVNGSEVRPHKYPWMAVMMKSYHHVCGGSIISDMLILTAGHCMYYIPSPLKSRWIIGSHSVKEAVNARQQSYDTKDYDLHPLWKAGNLFDNFDMALVITNRRMTFTSAAIPICMPKVGDEKLFWNQKVVIAGWGRVEENGAQTDVLMESSVYLKTHRECKNLIYSINYDERSMICAHEQHTDACQGDSGGPIFAAKSNDHYVILGVVSFGDGCARDFPGIYAKVSEPVTIKWINQKIASTNSNVCRNPEFSFMKRVAETLVK